MLKKSLSATIFLASLTSSVAAGELGDFILKAQGGYTMSDSSLDASTKTASSKIKNNDLNGYQGLVGFGYIASEDIWTDITVSFDSVKSKNDLKNKSIVQVENNNVTGMLNAYYGFNMGYSFSPYVMFGLGCGFSKAKAGLPSEGMQINDTAIKNTADKPLTGQLSSKNTSYFAYQGGFGMTFDVMKSIALDLGYRVGNGKTAKFNVPISGGDNLTLSPKERLKQAVLLGINIAF
jgi:opacity protein-like surface antigen